MARSIKFSDDTFLDAEGVAYIPPSGVHMKLTDYINKVGRNFYDSDADRNDISARITAMLHVINESLVHNIYSGTFIVRYASGYYYTYIFGYQANSTTVMEIVFGGDLINIFSGNLTTLNLKRSI